MAFHRHESVGGFTFLHQRADDVGLPPGFQLLPDELVQAVAPVFRHQPGLYRLTARGQLIDDAYIQIAEQAQGQRAGNGRGRHDQQMRGEIGGDVAALAGKAAALRYAEPVLFVGDDTAPRR